MRTVPERRRSVRRKRTRTLGRMITLLVCLAVGIALWQLYRRTVREREAAVQRERLRIARDMHDLLGRRLGLAAVQAGALEVASSDVETAASARRLGDALRDAAGDLHELVGVLRETSSEAGRDLTGIAALIADSRRAGADIELVQEGTPIALPPMVARAAYGVIEEGLANAAKHARSRSVRVAITWEADALLICISNPVSNELSTSVGGGSGRSGGFGLTGLSERVTSAGGLLALRNADGRFQLNAMLPVSLPHRSRRTAVLGIVTALVLLAIIPLSTVAAGPQ